MGMCACKQDAQEQAQERQRALQERIKAAQRDIQQQEDLASKEQQRIRNEELRIQTGAQQIVLACLLMCVDVSYMIVIGMAGTQDARPTLCFPYPWRDRHPGRAHAHPTEGG